MNLVDLKTLAKDLVDEKGLFWPDAQLTRLANMAQRTVYRVISDMEPTHLSTRSRITYTSGVEKIDLSTTLPSATVGIYRLLQAWRLVNNAAVSSSNRPQQLERVDISEAGHYSGYSQDPNVYQQSAYSLYRWALDNDDLYLMPIPTNTVYLDLRYILHVTDLSGASDAIFGGRAPEYHDLVVTVLTKLMTTKERRLSEEIAEAHNWLRSEFQQHERSRVQDAKIRYDSPY